MTETDFQDTLLDLLRALIGARDETDTDELAAITTDLAEQAMDFDRVETFADAQLLTTDAGLVVHTKDGGRFQITIVPC